jgi:flagellar biosynthesis/type III secretory pathway M-ring protein FliF/YscJ
MASIQDTVKKATRQLGEMTLSQRLAIGLGALLVIGSVFWLAQWAATPEMAPLLPGQSLTPEDMATVCAGLDALGEPYRIEGSQVLVRAGSKRQSILASLQQAEKLPTDTAICFAQLVQEANPWISQSENDRRWTVALQSELARVLREFHGVKQARVLLNMSTRKGFARTHPECSAGVTLWMSGGEPVSRSLALAAARMVAGAVRGLPVKNVQVIDGANNRVALDWDAEQNGSASNLHQQRRQLEREKAAQIKEQLSFDPDVLVSVAVDIDYTTMHVQDSTVTEGVTVQEETDSTSTVRNRRSGQPGVEPNVSAEITAGGSADTSTSDRSEMTSEPSRRQTTSQTPAGVPKSITAAVSLSYTYLASVFRHNNPDTEEITEQDIEDVFSRQKDRIAAHVAKLMIPSEVDQVSVDWHYDAPVPEQAGTGALDVPLEALTKYGPASGLGLLALVAMGMMLRLAKRQDSGDALGMDIGMPAEAIEAAKQAAEDIASATGQGPAGPGGRSTASVAPGGRGGKRRLPVGEAAEGILDAQEVDESSAQVARMIAQVAALTERDSEAVAGVIEGWIKQDR